MQIKKFVLTAMLFVPPISKANFLCVATSDSYPGLQDGLIFSKQIESLGAQGTKPGHIKLFEDKHYSFWLVGGTTIKIGDTPAKLVDFYVELRDIKTASIMRAKSSHGGDPKTAQLELVEYTENSLIYKGLAQFSCK